MHYQIVCNSCGHRIHSELLETSLKTNMKLKRAMDSAILTGNMQVLVDAILAVPPDIARMMREADDLEKGLS